jgi:hypothetical protein
MIFMPIFVSVILMISSCSRLGDPTPSINNPSPRASTETFVCPEIPIYAFVLQRQALPDGDFGSKITQYSTTQSIVQVYDWYRKTLPAQWKEVEPKTGILFLYAYLGLREYPETTLAIHPSTLTDSNTTVFLVELRFHHPHDSRDWCPSLQP